MRRIRKACRAGTLPEREVVAQFIEQIGVMVSYPGFGDAAYPDLLAASGELAASHANKDLTRFKAAMATIVTLRDRCHLPLPLREGAGGWGKNQP